MFIINEYQTSNGQTAIVTPVTKADQNEAESVYHTKLAAAAVSQVEVHTVTLQNHFGVLLMNGCYEHPAH